MKQKNGEWATEIYNLYFWWKIDRPNRNDPYDSNDAPIDNINAISEMYQSLYDEDTTQLVRLIQIRQYIWT